MIVTSHIEQGPWSFFSLVFLSNFTKSSLGLAGGPVAHSNFVQISNFFLMSFDSILDMKRFEWKSRSSEQLCFVHILSDMTK